jgi:hypothetical protein
MLQKNKGGDDGYSDSGDGDGGNNCDDNNGSTGGIELYVIK